MIREPSTVRTCFCGFPHRFRDFGVGLLLLCAFAGVLALAGLRPAGPENPKRAPLPFPPPLRTSLSGCLMLSAFSTLYS